jgi:hypothetical protein
MIGIIIGDLGKGKTLFLASLSTIIKTDIYSNFKLKHEKALEFSLNEFCNSRYENASVFLDEAYTYLESRLSLSERNRFMSYTMFQSRKKDINIYLTAQLAITLDVRYRDLADIWVYAHGNLNGKFAYTIIDKNKRKRVNILLDGAKYFDLYDTKEVIANDEQSDFFTKKESIKLIDKLKVKLIEEFPNAKFTRNLLKSYLYRNNYPAHILDMLHAEMQLEANLEN